MRSRLAAFVLASLALTACQATVTSAELKVGDCFNQTNSVDANGDSVASHAIVDCTQPHESEVFSVFDFPNATSAFPGYEQIGLVQQGQCQSDFEDYVGIPWDRSSYTISYASPDESTWAAGDRAIHCVLADASAGKLTGSAKDAQH